MIHLQGKKIFLRALNSADAGLLYHWENDTSIWKVSGTEKPFTRTEIENFIFESRQGFYATKQLRLMICLLSDSTSSSTTKSEIGCIDLFEFNEPHRSAGIGVLIADPQHRRRGFASEALYLLINYSFDELLLRHLYCSIAEDNSASMKLFLKHQFKITGKKKEWIIHEKKFTDVCILELAGR